MEWQGATHELEGERKPLCAWQAVYDEAKKHDKFIVIVEPYDEQKENIRKQKMISNQQMKYLHKVPFELLAKKMYCSKLWAEITLKRACGEEWLIKRVDDAELILSKTILTTEECSQWIKNIIDWCDSIKLHIPEPDKEWYKTKGGDS